MPVYLAQFKVRILELQFLSMLKNNTVSVEIKVTLETAIILQHMGALTICTVAMSQQIPLLVGGSISEANWWRLGHKPVCWLQERL